MTASHNVMTRKKIMKELKITLIEDSQALKDPIRRLMNSNEFQPGSDIEPVRGLLHGPDCWVYKGMVFRVEGAETTPEEEIKLRIKHQVFQKERKIQQIRREVEAFENFEKLPS